MRSRARTVSVLLGVLVSAALAFVAWQGVATLQLLTRVEAERDGWQRPGDVLAALRLAPGNVVVDLGSGSGYFSLKLSPLVGSRGRVLATDLRRLSLSFLWIRALGLPDRNVQVIRAEVDDPHLPTGPVDGVLVANTYHELSDRPRILAAVFRSLKPGGRLVILDRGPRRLTERTGESARGHHEGRLADAEAQVQQAGFQSMSADEHFIDLPGEDSLWWLLVAERP